MPTKTYDPLSCIPNADVVRERLMETNKIARKLGILLRTAEELEREERSQPDDRDNSESPPQDT